MNSFQRPTATMSAVATSPGRASGSMTEKKIRTLPAPSMVAASSSSLGSDRKKPVMRNTANGIDTPM